MLSPQRIDEVGRAQCLFGRDLVIHAASWANEGAESSRNLLQCYVSVRLLAYHVISWHRSTWHIPGMILARER